jgi:hypothetical protein
MVRGMSSKEYDALVTEHDAACLELLAVIDRVNDLKVRLREMQKEVGIVP